MYLSYLHRAKLSTNTPASQQYHPDDLKGKGEPNFTRDRKEKEARGAATTTTGTNEIEMQSSPLMGNRGKGRARSATHGGEASAPMIVAPAAEASASGANVGKDPEVQTTEVGVGRRSSTHRISDGLKRRFGSLRRKKGSSPEAE